MVTRKRLNLSLADVDFQRLCDAATSEGKLPTSYALDVIKVALSQIKRQYKPVRLASEPLSFVSAAQLPTVQEKRLEPPVMSRQQRRALERQIQKGKK